MAHPDNFSDVAFAERYERKPDPTDELVEELQPIDAGLAIAYQLLEQKYWGKRRDDEYWKQKKKIDAAVTAMNDVELNCYR